MTPKYFHVVAWSREPYASSYVANSLVESGISPTTFDGELTFKIGHDGSTWHDLVMARSAIILFSESVREAVEADGLVGARFIEAPIVEVLSSQLRKKPMPRYYRLLAEGIIEVKEQVAQNKQRRLIPSETHAPMSCDFFHAKYPKGIGGYYCSFRAIETFRRHKLKNFYITPMDYIDEGSDPFAPPFRIKLSERKWPPKVWYPGGFLPHPNNLVDE